METYSSDEHFLRKNDQFNRLPDRLQELILQSPNASADFRSFFAAGGEMRLDEKEPLAAYRAEPDRVIFVNSGKYNLAYKNPEGAYMAERLFSMLAHEIGHDKDRTSRFSPDIDAEGYVRYCSTKEARAIFNAFPIFADLKRTEPTFCPHWNAVGYDSMGLLWPGMYNSWRNGQIDKEAVINKIADAVPNFPYTRDDDIGDQFKTWRDYYLHEFHAQQRNKTLSQESSLDAPAASDSRSETDILFDRVYEALINKDDDALRALGTEYFQSPDGQQLLQEGRELRESYERKADALALAQGRPLPTGYSIGTLTGKQDPRDWDHPDHALYSAIRRELPREVSDEMAAHVMLQARQASIHDIHCLEHVAVYDNKAFVAGRNYVDMAPVHLSQTPPPMEDTVQQSQRLDEKLALDHQERLALQQEQARNGPSRSL